MAYPTTVTTTNSSTPSSTFNAADHNNNKSRRQRNNNRAHNNMSRPVSPSSVDSLDNMSVHSESSHSESSYDSSAQCSANLFAHSYKKRPLPHHSQYVAMDCEMVGSLEGKSVCARVCLVDWKGRTLLDTYVSPPPGVVVTDYRTFVSGITPDNLVDAPSLEQVQQHVAIFLKEKILVGHALVNDLECLRLSHPWQMTRDTALYRPFQQRHPHTQQWVPRKLKDLVAEKLNGAEIQTAGKAHCPAEDATAALNLYKQHRPRWEACLQSEMNKARQLEERQQRQRQQQALVLERQRQYYLMQQQQHHAALSAYHQQQCLQRQLYPQQQRQYVRQHQPQQPIY